MWRKFCAFYLDIFSFIMTWSEFWFLHLNGLQYLRMFRIRIQHLSLCPNTIRWISNFVLSLVFIALGFKPGSMRAKAVRSWIQNTSVGDRDILVRIRILGSLPLTNGSGCGSRRPKNIRIPRIRIQMLMILNTCTFTSFLKDKKSHKEVTKH